MNGKIKSEKFLKTAGCGVVLFSAAVLSWVVRIGAQGSPAPPAAAPAMVDFVKDIQPIFEKSVTAAMARKCRWEGSGSIPGSSP